MNFSHLESLGAPDQLAEMRKSLRNQLNDASNRGLIKEMIGWAGTTKDRPLQTVRDVTLEQFMFFYLLSLFALHTPQRDRFRIEFPGYRQSYHDELAAAIAHWLHVAPPYLWTSEMRQATQAMQLPRHRVEPGMLPKPFMWWTWDTDIPDPKSDRQSVGWLVGEAPGQYHITVFEELVGVQSPSLAITPGTIAANGWLYPDEFPPEALQPYEVFAKMVAFLNSPFVEVQQRPLDRATRRRLVATGRSGHPVSHDVYFVVLRRKSPRTPPPETPTGTGRTYSVQWIVSGHIRNQWYPSEQRHKLIWIAPYTKGPQGAPLKTTTYKVAR
jgi:hypothetical protein